MRLVESALEVPIWRTARCGRYRSDWVIGAAIPTAQIPRYGLEEGGAFESETDRGGLDSHRPGLGDCVRSGDSSPPTSPKRDRLGP